MKNTLFTKCLSTFLTVSLALTLSAPLYPVFAYDDDSWSDYDASLPEIEPERPQYTPPPVDAFDAFDAIDLHSDPGSVYTPPTSEPSYTPSYGSYSVGDSYSSSGKSVVDEGFIKVIKHPRQGHSDVQNAIIEGLQVSTDKGSSEDEIIVNCYFIFRDKPTSYFYDVDRKEKKLVFEFMDSRTGSSPIAALEQSPIKEIVIDEMQADANRSVKGLNPEWHDLIRITFQLEYLPVISVTGEQNIVTFSYKWTTNPEKYDQYVEKDRFPLVFWISGGTLGGIGAGVLTYFLIPKKEKIISNVLTTDDLPGRSR